MKPIHDLSSLSLKIFADGADKVSVLRLGLRPWIRGFTTNPTLMRKVGVSDYRAFARELLDVVTDRPISFEVVSDTPDEIEREALEISSWAENVYVKIPITTTSGETLCPVIRHLSQKGIKINVTAVLALSQVRDAGEALSGGAPAVISVFAGRVADTGRDPMPHMAAARELLSIHPNVELLWASPRELLNVFQAETVGCHIITVTEDLLNKAAVIGKDLLEYSRETVQMFFTDARRSRLTVRTNARRP